MDENQAVIMKLNPGEERREMDNRDWHAAGMGASMIVLFCAIAFVLVVAWGAACGISHSTAAICQ